MTIELKEGRYFIAFMFAEIDLQGARRGNIMGAAFRDPGDVGATLIYRVRWYVDDKLDHTSEDEKNWYQAAIPSTDTDDAVIEKLRFFLHTVAMIAGAKDFTPTLVEVRTDDQEKAIGLLAAQPWAHLTLVGAIGQSMTKGNA